MGRNKMWNQILEPKHLELNALRAGGNSGGSLLRIESADLRGIFIIFSRRYQQISSFSGDLIERRMINV